MSIALCSLRVVVWSQARVQYLLEFAEEYTCAAERRRRTGTQPGGVARVISQSVTSCDRNASDHRNAAWDLATPCGLGSGSLVLGLSLLVRAVRPRVRRDRLGAVRERAAARRCAGIDVVGCETYRDGRLSAASPSMACSRHRVSGSRSNGRASSPYARLSALGRYTVEVTLAGEDSVASSRMVFHELSADAPRRECSYGPPP